MSQYYTSRSACDRAFPVDESLVEDPMRERRAACYSCVDNGNVFAATMSGEHIVLGCQQRVKAGDKTAASMATMRTIGYGAVGYALGATLTGYALHGGKGSGNLTDWRQVAGGIVGAFAGVLLSKKA